MPELPEVETIRRQLNKALKGLKIEKIEVLSPKNFLGLPQTAVNEKVMRVERRAKIILIKLTHDKCLAIHLKLTGQLIFRSQAALTTKAIEKNGPFAVSELPNKYTRVIISFANGNRLYLNDLRKFGWIKVMANGKWQMANGFKSFGPEPFSQEFSADYLGNIFSKTSRPVKLVIMDQEKLAGVGNIYANEALFTAGIDPSRPAKSLNKAEASRLRQAIISVLKSAIKHQGTSDKDEAYRQISGKKGRHQDFLLVYGREKEKCPQCGGTIRKIKLGGRGTYFCSECQR